MRSHDMMGHEVGMMEGERKLHFRQMITRHAERMPSGELRPEGIENAKRKGALLADSAVALESFASDHPSGRAVETAEYISQQSGLVSSETGSRLKTKKVYDVQYEILKPDGEKAFNEIKLIIEEGTLKEIYEQHPEIAQLIDEAVSAVDEDKKTALFKKDSKGQSMVDIEKLPKNIQLLIAPIRQKNQMLGFRHVLSDPTSVHRLATGIAHQIVESNATLKMYAKSPDKFNGDKKDVVANTVTHGLFVESLFSEAGIYVGADGEEIHGMKDFESTKFGGYIQPTESIYLDFDDPNNLPDRIPVAFDASRKTEGKFYLDKRKLEQLNDDYLNSGKPLVTYLPQKKISERGLKNAQKLREQEWENKD